MHSFWPNHGQKRKLRRCQHISNVLTNPGREGREGRKEKRKRNKLYTLHKLLAGILLEKCLMLDRSDQVINHQMENWKHLLFGVIREVDKVCILRW